MQRDSERTRTEIAEEKDVTCRTISRFLYPCERQSFLWAGHCWPALATYPRVERSGPLLLSYLVLLRMGFTLPPGSLRTRCALTAPFHPYPGTGRYLFCGTFRKTRFERILPAVSRHAALWRPDFPPRERGDYPSGKLRSHYRTCHGNQHHGKPGTETSIPDSGPPQNREEKRELRSPSLVF